MAKMETPCSLCGSDHDHIPKECLPMIIRDVIKDVLSVNVGVETDYGYSSEYKRVKVVLLLDGDPFASDSARG